jgi:hypothetical protein
MSCTYDGRRLAVSTARRDQEELRLIVAAGGDPERLQGLARPAALSELKALGFANVPLLRRLVAALFAWDAPHGPATAEASDGNTPSPPPVVTSTITLKHKVQNGARQLRVRTTAISALDFAADGVAFVALPPAILPELSVLQTLVEAEEADLNFEAFTRARAALETWLNAWLPTATQQREHAHLYLRHCIVRSTPAGHGPAGMQRKTLPLQRPGRAFHIDSDHTELVNIWLPLSDAPLSDNQLGFLLDGGSVTTRTVTTQGDPHRVAAGEATGSRLLDTAGLKRLYAGGKEAFAEFERGAAVAYKPGMRWGDAIVFRSGGQRAVVHGNFRFDSEGGHRTDAPRRSVEFRCQPQDESLGFVPTSEYRV